MSWVQWNGATLPTTDDEVDLRLYLWPPDCGYPRTSWKFDLFHLFRPPEAETAQEHSRDQWVSVEIPDLFFHENNWRRFSRHEIRATPAWHDANEHFTQHHRLVESRITLSGPQQRRTPDEARKTAGQENWYGHDYILRFGERDGLHFPCELDAWLIHQDDFALPKPQDPAAIPPFASTPPNLRVISRATFASAAVAVPRAFRADPVAAARGFLEEAIAYDGRLHDATISWDIHRDLETGQYVHNPGWSSTVSFSTAPST